MRNYRVIAPLALAAAAALAAGVAALLKKPVEEAVEAAAPKTAPIAPQALRTGSYSFISGYQNAVTVDMEMDYDSEKYSFVVIEDEFPSYSSDSHVAVVYGEDFNLQIEYAAFYRGEDFAAHCKSLAERYQELAPVQYGALEGVRYLDGDNICLNLPIPGDQNSYLLVTVMKTPEYDGELAALPEHPELQAMLATLRFKIH